MRVDVKGEPITQGSMNAFPIRRKDGSIGVSMTHQKGNKLDVWRQAVAEAYKAQDGTYYPQYTPVCFEGTFYLKRPAKPHAWLPSAKGSDLDKLTRAILDSLSEVAYYDDCQVCDIRVRKDYADCDEDIGLVFYLTELKE
jgi:Holliday junction resolvase RusA-like endonuclease